MSEVDSTLGIRAALETALAEMMPAIATAWQRTGFNAENPADVAADEPYQRAEIIWNDPANNENSASYTERGLFQVTLCFPPPSDTVPAGQGPLERRAHLLRRVFKRGASFTAHGVTVTIDRTGSLLPPYSQHGRDCLPVRFSFYAHISA